MRKSVIFLHGGPGYGEYLSAFFKDHLAGDFQCIFYEQLRKSNISIDDLVNELIQKMGTDNNEIYLVGHSWGGMLAIETYRRSLDQRIKGIVFIDSCLCANDMTNEYRKELDSLGIHNPTTEQIFFTTEEAEVAKDFLKKIKDSFDEDIFRHIEREFLSTYDVRAFAKTITIPILNIFGEKDIRIPSRVIRTYPELNSKFKNLEIRNAGHFPFILQEHRAQVASGIKKFVLD